MMNEWKKYQVKDIIQIIKEGYKPNTNDEIPYLGLEHINEQSLSINSIGSAQDITSNKFFFRNGDTLFGKLRPYFRKVYKPSFNGICSTDIWVFRAKKGFDKGFIFYLVANPSFVDRVSNANTGTRMPRGDWDFIKETTLNIPPLDEQKQIADVLSCLDAKIENLRRQNKTLEQIAQTLFKHWFIDFEFPNADGKPYKSSGGAMVASELGDIPEGWKVVNLKNVMTLNYGKPLTSDNRINGKYPVVGSNGIVDTHNDFFVQAPGIVIGRKGTIGKVIWIEENFYPIDTTFYIEDILGCEGLYFHYFLLKSQKFNRLTSDSAVPGLNRDMAYSVEFSISSNTLINQYNSIAKPVFDKISNNSKQIQTLTKTRDSLLPKLMSGQLRVGE